MINKVLRNHSIDSTHWCDFVYRPNDIVIASWGKSGTTWVQQIVGQLISNGDPRVNPTNSSIWLDSSWPSANAKLRFLARQKHRRFIKTHLAPEYLPFSDAAKYIYVARDPRDAIWSLHNHLMHLPDNILALINKQSNTDMKPLIKPDPDPYIFWMRWLTDDSYPMWPFWSHIRDWWAQKDKPNVKFLHFSLLKSKPNEVMRDIGAFLDIDTDRLKWEQIIEHSSFKWMKMHSNGFVPWGITAAPNNDWFINKGTNGRWESLLSKSDEELFIQKAIAELGPECTQWLINGHALKFSASSEQKIFESRAWENASRG